MVGLQSVPQDDSVLPRISFRPFDLLLAVPPIPVTRTTWEIYGQTKAALSENGIKIPDVDLLIASTAKYHDMILVANDKHMKNLPDSFVRENWAKV